MKIIITKPEDGPKVLLTNEESGESIVIYCYDQGFKLHYDTELYTIQRGYVERIYNPFL